MRILFCLRYNRDQASSRVRGFYIAEELKRRGLRCDVIHGYGWKVHMTFLVNLLRYDIIYFQKRFLALDLKLNKLARLAGRKSFFDIDDAPGGTRLSIQAERQAIGMIRRASATVVGSHRLRDFAQKFSNHVYLIPSSIDLNYYKPGRERKNRNYVTVGWIGNGIAYKEDLLMLMEPLERVGERYEIKLTIIGALEQKEIHCCFSRMKNVTVEIIDFIDWADPIAVPLAISGFDIGLYPLLNNEYNQYKCGFKALEYMAMEIPVIASPVGQNMFIVENGKNGFLASNEKEWEEKILYLVENEEVRKRMGKAGRMKIEKNYSVGVCADKLITALNEVER